jgi:hypothetical protein
MRYRTIHGPQWYAAEYGSARPRPRPVDFEDEIQRVAHWIADVIDAKCAEEVVQRVRELVLKLCRRFPVYVAKARQ